MPFTVADFPDLLRLLGEHPEWQAALRRHILTDELLAVPGRLDRVEAALEQLTVRVDQLAARLEELTVRVDQLTVRVDQLAARLEELTVRVEQLAVRVDQLAARLEELTVRVDALAEAQARTEQQLATLTARVDALAEAQARTEQQLAELAEAQRRTEERLQRIEVHVGDLRGEAVERRYRDRAPAYFGRLLRRLRVLDAAALADRLDRAVEEGRLSEAERDTVLLADVVATGRRVPDEVEAYLLAEVSAGVGPDDVRRAAARAAALARLGRPVLPVVAGEVITADAATLARTQGVWQVLDGRLTPPSDG